MDMGLPLICPLLHYDKFKGYWACEQIEEYEVLRKTGWPAAFCNGAYTGRSDYLKCPIFSQWFWERSSLPSGTKSPAVR